MVNAMHPRTALRFVLVGVVCALLCPSLVYAQWLKRLEPCLPYPTLAQEIHEMNEEVDAKVGITPEPEQRPPRIVVDEVKFDAPIHLSDSGREQLLFRLKQDEIHDSPQWLDEMQEARIRAAWQDEGFFKVQTTATVEILRSDVAVKHVSVSVHVNEGLQYRLGSIQFRSSDADDPVAFPPEQLRKLVVLKEGDPFSVDKIRQSLDALKNLYSANGYSDFVATPLTEIHDEERQISLIMEMEQEKQFRVGKVEVLGNDLALEALFRSKFKSGDIFDERSARDFLKEYKAVLPPNVLPEDLWFRRNVRSGTVDVRFSFDTCPKLED
jgi:outer membrane protein assembly factor BamA